MIGPDLKDSGNDTFAMFGNAVDVNQAKNGSSINSNLPFGMPQGYHTLIQSDYNGAIPSPVFYEHFTQTSYWERQEIRTMLPSLGVYYVVVFDMDGSGKSDKNNSSSDSSINEGKFGLAVGETEDFSMQDYLVLLPYSWIKVKLLFNDYLSIFVAFTVFVFLVIILPSTILIMRRKRKKGAN